MRQFELTAVISDTSTSLSSFNFDYQLKLYYSPLEISPIIGGNDNVQLYRWNGSSWQQVGSTSGSSSENLLYIYTNLTGHFAVRGPTHNVFLPLCSKFFPLMVDGRLPEFPYQQRRTLQIEPISCFKPPSSALKWLVFAIQQSMKMNIVRGVY